MIGRMVYVRFGNMRVFGEVVNEDLKDGKYYYVKFLNKPLLDGWYSSEYVIPVEG